MLTFIALMAACGLGSEEPPPTETPREAAIPNPNAPALACPEGTHIESASSEEGDQFWCDREGVMDGPFQQYYPKRADGDKLGEKAASGAFLDNEPDGPWIWWHENGTPQRKGKYNKGKQTGSWTWWHQNGVRKEEGDFLNGRRQGQWTTYYDSGLKQSEGMYQNNMKTGTWSLFDDDPENSVSLTQTYENDEVVKEQKPKKRKKR